MPFKKGQKPWNKGKSWDTKTLRKISDAVKKSGHLPPSQKGYKHTEETKKKIGLSGLGRRHAKETKLKISMAHGNRKGWITPVNMVIRNSTEMKLWRKAVFERDHYQCIWGGKEHGNKLQADHIKPFALFPELRFAIDNGRTLCFECHKKTDTYGWKSKK